MSGEFELDHAGFVARFGPSPADRRLGCAFPLLPIVWTGLLVGGVGPGGMPVDATMCCMLATIPLIWGIAAVAVDQAILREELRLVGGRLWVYSARGPWSRRDPVPLHGLQARVDVSEGSRGGRSVHLTLATPDRTWTLNGSRWSGPAALQPVADLVNGLAAAVPPAESHVPPEAIRALLATVSSR